MENKAEEKITLSQEPNRALMVSDSCLFVACSFKLMTTFYRVKNLTLDQKNMYRTILVHCI